MRRPVPAPVSRSHSGTGARERPAYAHGTEPAPAAEAPKATFGEVAAEKAGAVAPTGPLDQLRAGQIDRSTYVDLKVEEATKHLVGLLPPAEIERVQAELRDLIEHDPDVGALVKAAETAR